MYRHTITAADLHHCHHQAPLDLSAQPCILLHNTMSGPWPDPPPAAAVTPLAKLLSASFEITPTTMPSLPLLSPSATPCLDMGFSGLASCSSAQSLEHVMEVATDPMSRHFFHLNMVNVEEVDHEAMDALMEVHRDAAWAHAAAHALDQRAPRLGLADSITASNLSPWPALQMQLQLQSPEAALLGMPGEPALLSAASVVSKLPSCQAPPCCTDGDKTYLSSAWVDVPTRPSSAASSGTAADSPPRHRHCASQQVSATMQPLLTRARVKKEAGVGDEVQVDGGDHTGASTGHNCEEGPQLGLSVSFLDENGYFDMTLREAAEQLGVGVTTLKKLCRQSGLGRWPYRARCSLRSLREKMREYFSCAPAEEREAADALMEREFCRLAHMNVGNIDDAFKQFRQAMFKLEFKARQQLESNRSSASVPRKRPHSAAASSADGELSTVFHGDALFRQQAMLHLRRLLHACSDGTY